jgi:hypothetical protein
MADTLALSYQHMQRQVREAAAVQAALSAAYKRTMQSSNLDLSFRDFSRYALPLIVAGRARGQQTADLFYLSAKAQVGLGAELPVATVPGLDTERWETDLRVNGPVLVKQQLARGVATDYAMAVAGAATLRVAKRLVLESSRQRLISLTESDKRARGWSRVSDGAPCAFCAMLVSRGPVYSGGTANFRAHNGCGCSVAPVFENDKTGGWSPQARKLADLWKENPELSSFRSALSSPTPSS